MAKVMVVSHCYPLSPCIPEMVNQIFTKSGQMNRFNYKYFRLDVVDHKYIKNKSMLTNCLFGVKGLN